MESNADSQRLVCLITGGSDGIGLAAARIFANRGYDIALCGRDPQKIERAIAQIRSSAPNIDVVGIPADLSQVNDAKRFAESALHQLGRCDVLINNAATAPLGPFADIAPDIFERTLDTNIRSVFYLTQLVWRRMMGQGSGVVVNISSLAAVDPFTGFSLYGATKAWLDLLTIALADEGAQYGLRVYSIRPGAVETQLLRGLFPDFPADQCVSPDDIAHQIWKCVSQPDQYPSGTHHLVTRQV